MKTPQYLPQRRTTAAKRRRLRRPFHQGEARGLRTGSAATVLITYTRDRYARGEVVLQTLYVLEDGSVDRDPPRRVHYAEQTVHFVNELWELLFDHAAAAAQEAPASLIIRLDLPEDRPKLGDRVRLIAQIVAREMRIPVAGTAPNPADWG